MGIEGTIVLLLQCEIQDKRIMFRFTGDDVEGAEIFNNQTDPGSEPSRYRVKFIIILS